MNIILYLNKSLSYAIALYIMEELKLPNPIYCANYSDLDEFCNKQRPYIIITELAIVNDKIKGKELLKIINCNTQCRKIVLAGTPIVEVEDLRLVIKDTETINRLKKAIDFCLEEPGRRLYSVCLVGVKYAEYVNNPAETLELEVGKEPYVAIRKLQSFSEIKWGDFYLIIDQLNDKLFRYIYPSIMKNHYLLKIDRQSTPNEYRTKPVSAHISVTDILAIFSIMAEVRAF